MVRSNKMIYASVNRSVLRSLLHAFCVTHSALPPPRPPPCPQPPSLACLPCHAQGSDASSTLAASSDSMWHSSQRVSFPGGPTAGHRASNSGISIGNIPWEALKYVTGEVEDLFYHRQGVRGYAKAVKRDLTGVPEISSCL